MGNYCYLNTEDDGLFEAKYSIPFFWFLGLEKKEQDILIEQTRDFFSQSIEYSDDNFADIKISKKKYIEKLVENKKYVKSIYPYLFDMYLDFINTVENNCINSKFIEINYLDVISMSDEKTSVSMWNNLFFSLTNFIENNLLEGTNILGSTIGYDYGGELYDKYSDQFTIPEPIDLIHSQVTPQSKFSNFLAKKDLTVTEIFFYFTIIIIGLGLFYLNLFIFFPFIGIALVILNTVVNYKKMNRQMANEYQKTEKKKKQFEFFFTSFLNKSNRSVNFCHLNIFLTISKVLSDDSEMINKKISNVIGNSEVFFQTYKSNFEDIHFNESIDLLVQKMTYYERMIWLLYFEGFLTRNFITDSKKNIAISINKVLKQKNLKEISLEKKEVDFSNIGNTLQKYVLVKINSDSDCYNIGIITKENCKVLLELVGKNKLPIIFEYSYGNTFLKKNSSQFRAFDFDDNNSQCKVDEHKKKTTVSGKKLSERKGIKILKFVFYCLLFIIFTVYGIYELFFGSLIMGLLSILFFGIGGVLYLFIELDHLKEGLKK